MASNGGEVVAVCGGLVRVVEFLGKVPSVVGEQDPGSPVQRPNDSLRGDRCGDAGNRYIAAEYVGALRGWRSGQERFRNRESLERAVFRTKVDSVVEEDWRRMIFARAQLELLVDIVLRAVELPQIVAVYDVKIAVLARAHSKMPGRVAGVDQIRQQQRACRTEVRVPAVFTKGVIRREVVPDLEASRSGETHEGISIAAVHPGRVAKAVAANYIHVPRSICRRPAAAHPHASTGIVGHQVDGTGLLQRAGVKANHPGGIGATSSPQARPRRANAPSPLTP